MRERGNITVGFGGVGFCSLLTIAFIVLKLCKVIEWNWFWVFSPTIFSLGLWVLGFIVLLISLLFIRRA